MKLKHFSYRLLPGSCLLCEQRSRRDRDLCDPCLHDLPFIKHACARCAIPVQRGARTCGGCLRSPPPYDLARAAFRYDFPLDRLILRFKFFNDQAAGALLGELFAQRMQARPGAVLLPVPLHVTRLRERGFNQAELLARMLAGAHHLPLRTDVLRRVRATEVQSGMNAAARRRNVKNAFAVVATPPAHAVIVDDVVTTGSTVREIAMALRRAGTDLVEVWSLARAD